MNRERQNRQPRWWRYCSYALLALSVVITAGFFLSHWLVNADIGGQHDLGMAIAMAFGSVLGIYASILLAGINTLLAVLGTLAGKSARMLWLAVIVALVPSAWLLLAG